LKFAIVSQRSRLALSHVHCTSDTGAHLQWHDTWAEARRVDADDVDSWTCVRWNSWPCVHFLCPRHQNGRALSRAAVRPFVSQSVCPMPVARTNTVRLSATVTIKH